MRKLLELGLVLLVTITLGGCDLVGDLIELTFWLAAIVVIFLVALASWVWRKIRGPRRP